MADANPINPGDDSQIASGGDRPRGLDLTDPKDQATVRKAMKRWPKRWRGLSDAFKDSLVDDLVIAKTRAVELIQSTDDAALLMKAIDAVNSTARTAVAMEGQVQADEHFDEKNARLDEGKATENIAGISFHIVQAEKPKAIE